MATPVGPQVAAPGTTVPGVAPSSAQGLPGVPQAQSSWHWRRSDPLGGLYSRYPFKLLIHDHVGLDVGSNWLKYAVTRHGAGVPHLLSAGAVPIVQEGVGQLGKLRAQVAALLAVRDKVPRGSERWIVGVSGQGTIVRTVEVPRMPRRELRKAVLWQAQKKIPFPLEDAHVAITYLKSGPGQPVRAVVSAAIRRLVDDLLYLLAEAEIKPMAVTLPAFGLGRMLAGGAYGAPGESCCVLDLGAERCLFAVYRGGQLEFYREIDLGVSDVEESLAQDLQLGRMLNPNESAGAGLLLFEKGFVVSPDAEAAAQDTARKIREATEKLLLEIQNTLEYFSAQSGGVRINRFLLLGGGSQIPGIERHLSDFLEAPVERFDPLHQIPDHAALPKAELLNSSRWASAYGFSLLPHHVANLLPPDYVHERDAEFRSLLWRSATGTLMAVSLLLSGAEYYRGELATERADLLEARLNETAERFRTLGGPAIQTSLAAHQRWLAALARRDTRAESILQWFSRETPSEIALDRIEVRPVDSGWTGIDLQGEVRSAHDQNEVVLAHFIERISSSGLFQNVELKTYSTTRRSDYEQMLFQLKLRSPLSDRTP